MSPLREPEHDRTESIRATGDELSELLRGSLGGRVFKVSRRSGSLVFTVRGNKAAWNSLKQRQSGKAGPSGRGGSILAKLERAGLVGCVNSGLMDLATNKKHMEGFGRD